MSVYRARHIQPIDRNGASCRHTAAVLCRAGDGTGACFQRGDLAGGTDLGDLGVAALPGHILVVGVRWFDCLDFQLQGGLRGIFNFEEYSLVLCPKYNLCPKIPANLYRKPIPSCVGFPSFSSLTDSFIFCSAAFTSSLFFSIGRFKAFSSPILSGILRCNPPIISTSKLCTRWIDPSTRTEVKGF